MKNNRVKILVLAVITAGVLVSFNGGSKNEKQVDSKTEKETPKKKSTQEDVYDFRSAEEHGLMIGFPPPESKRVTKSNALMSAPFNRWSYQNMKMFYPTAGIPNSENPYDLDRTIDTNVQGLSVSKPDQEGLPTSNKVNMDTYLQETYSDALVVIKDGDIVYEKYLNNMNADQPHQMMSVTKSFAGLFGLMAVADGEAKEEDVVSSIIPELKKSTGFGDATFGQVLDMTNSVDFSEDYADPESGIVHYATVLGFMDPQEGKTYANSIYEYLPTLQLDKEYPHGDIFHYQTPKTDVVNWITNRATNKSFQDNMSDKLWSKIGANGNAYVLLDKNATLFAGGGLNATPNDLAKFAAMMINDGKVNGKKVVSPEVIQKLSDGGSVEAFSNGPNATGAMKNNDWSYRAQWWVRHTPGKNAFTAIGIHGQWIYIDIDNNIAIIKQSSQPTSADGHLDGYNLNAFDTIIEHLTKNSGSKS